MIDRSCLEEYGILSYGRLVGKVEFHVDIIRDENPEALLLIHFNKILNGFLNGNFYTKYFLLL